MPSRDDDRSRRRRRRVLVLLAATALFLAGWKASTPVGYQVRLFLARRSIEADRLDEADDRLDILITENPTKTWPRFLQAQVARKRGRITEAEETLQRAIELGLPIEQARAEHELLIDRAVSDPLSAATTHGRSVLAEGSPERR